MTKFERLMVSVIASSKANTWKEAVKEWKVAYLGDDLGGSNCTCGKEIKKIYQITNRFTEKTLIIGSSCVKKFERDDFTEYVKEIDKERAKKKALLKKQEKEIQEARDCMKYRKTEYELLKIKQTANQIPVSIRFPYLVKRLHNGVINTFEYNFYVNIFWRADLTNKQWQLKQKINTKLLNN